MAGRQDVLAGSAFVRLFLKDQMTKALVKSLQKASKNVRAFGARIFKLGAPILAAGTAMTGFFAAAVKTFARTGDTLDKMSLRTGIAAGDLAALGFAAEQSGTDMATVEKGVKRMQASILDLEQGLSTAVDTFDMLGITLAEIKGLDPGAQFDLIASRIAAIEDPTRRAALAQEAFGKAGTMLLPMMGDLKALKDEAERLNLIPTQESIDNAAKVTDALNRVKRTVSAAFFEVGASLAKPVLRGLKVVTKFTARLSSWVKENKGLVKTIAAVSLGVMAAGLVVVALGGAIIGVGFAISALATIIAVTGAAIGFLLSPIGLFAAALIGSVVAWVKFTESGQNAVDAVKGKLAGLLGFLKSVFGGIIDAIKVGDFKLAFEIIKTAGMLAFKVIADRAVWIFKTLIPAAAIGVMKGIASAFGVAVGSWREVIVAFWNLFTTIAGAAFSFLVANWKSQFRLVGDLTQAFWDALINGAPSAVQNIIAVLINGFIVVGEFIRTSFSKSFDFAVEHFVEGALAAAGFVAKQVLLSLTGKVGQGIAAFREIRDAGGGKVAAAAANDARRAAGQMKGAALKGFAGMYEIETPKEVAAKLFADIAKATTDHATRLGEAASKASADMAPSIKEFADTISTLGAEAREALSSEFTKSIQDAGTFETSEAQQALREKLDGLIATAAEKAAEKKTEETKAPPNKGGGVVPGSADGGIAQPAGIVRDISTFSAAAAQAIGFTSDGLGPQQKIAQRLIEQNQILKEQRAINRKQLSEAEKVAWRLQAIERGLVYAP